MAEQISHNVVNGSELTSGSPLVDVSANQSTIASALSGSKTAPASSDILDDATIAATDGSAKAGPAKDAAEPSAGDVAAQSAPGSYNLAAVIANGDLVNGINEGDGSADERSVADVSLDLAAEHSRADAGGIQDPNHHMRTNSVKRPATFSKVTATKNFLAKTASPTPTISKPGDRPNPTTIVAQPTAKPRLVAKSAGPSLRDIQKARADGPNGPDASKVWNKNRPVAPPPPRQFTDEELKQQYGIHLATRLQADESGKESKWADIDDEEDDWVPEQVVWMDGTKSSLAPQEVSPPPKDEQVEAPQPVKPMEGVKPILANMKKSEPTTRTILKPGAAIASSQAKLVSSSNPSTGPEKPSLKSKSPAPPAKSPWAPVPKVESVSPINPPVQQSMPPPQFATQDARAYAPQPTSYPAREIAADTFDRSWREGEGASRELFNSTNGRYEPAPEGRRHPGRNETSGRKPSVLQRPSQNGIAPAEPSPAFQTRTASQSEGSWGRRRGSSVSQGSVSAVRRMSVSKGSEISEEPEQRPNNISTSQSAQPSFPQQSAWEQQMPAKPASDVVLAPPAEDQVKAQERIMKEKRELAKKRREEELAQEEAEKQERLKLKLAMLESAGKSRKEREAEAAAATKPAKASPPAEQPQVQPEPARPAEVSAALAPVIEAQTLQQAPDQPVAGAKPGEDVMSLPSPIPSKYQSSAVSADEVPRQVSRTHLSPRAAPGAPYQQGQASFKGPSSSYSSPGDRKPQPAFQRSPALENNNASGNTFTPWGPATTQTSNVWGSSGIGNGVFENSLAHMPMTPQGSILPPPPGMGRPTTSKRISPQNFNHEANPPAEAQRGYAAPAIDTRVDSFGNQTRLHGVSPAPGSGRPAHPPGPIAPPSRSQQQAVQRPDAIAAWQAASERLPAQFATATEQSQAEPPATEAPKYTPTFNHTFKKTTVDPSSKLGGARRFEKVEHSIHDAQGSRVVSALSPAPPNAQTQPSGPFTAPSPVQDLRKQLGESTVRIPDGSQNPAHGGLPVRQPPIGSPSAQQGRSSQTSARYAAGPLAPTIESKEQSPPPPESADHPVNEGDTNHPHVRLPPPQAKVKLPPSSPVASVSATSSNGMVASPLMRMNSPSGMKPIVQTESWQARFNGLFHKTQVATEIPPSPPGTPPKSQGPALAVASSSRAPLDNQNGPTYGAATVSLPQKFTIVSAEGFVLDDSIEMVSKPPIDPIFHAEQSFGSMPKVRVPKDPRYAAPFNGMRMFTNSRVGLPASLDSPQTVVDPAYALIHRPKEGYYLKIPGTRLQNKLVPSKDSGTPSSRTGKDRRSLPSQGASERKPSGKFSRTKVGKDSVTPPSASTSSRSRIEGVKRGTSERKTEKSSPAPFQSSPAGKDSTSGSAPSEHKRRAPSGKPFKGPGTSRHQASAVATG